MFLSFVMNNNSLGKNQTAYFFSLGANDIRTLTITYMLGRKHVHPDYHGEQQHQQCD